MKTSSVLLASALCLGTVAAHATPDNGFGETYPNFQPHTQSTLTRSAVEADVMAARKAGTMRFEGDGYDQPAPMTMRHSNLTRQAVETDRTNARAAGYLEPEGNRNEASTPTAPR
ncbi:DUF4148 domain-containing protein [Simplicispira psychrophila]|uniref:DUF4148 domain-containing protein n=1 Tax=Simplicispira psychrophila TaxID=80882 RepID=UPI00068A8ACD|nr:DUF4148 domain-containing protein [Simplicispira psychrophila]